MKIAFYGGQSTGMIVLLNLIAKGHNIRAVFCEDEKIEKIAEEFNLQIFPKHKLDDQELIEKLAKQIDLLLCCHGKKIFSPHLVKSIPCINIHPCLYKYKGAKPILRLINDGVNKASVASHWMTEKVDGGKVIVEKFIRIDSIKNKVEADVYNDLYPLYIEVVNATLAKIHRHA
ncbi:hypothetical protein A3D81_01100 [Candidatus Curtissbacteria bacterium RIFCSPHIGHO2_02_FULL_40_17]|uniref:phosphoribosylglycinamide formyltransferase 1 n=4 Tax=Candidatus Curtissiibacteriota TaxID=1752717 RepID=A0A1F5GHP5_9BACT|nr:MAG: hypothetical protein A2693_03225 [Candidatus Curtissbacteria bacterium RIFCSPHIGHO2_01_FULL_40_12]OGD91380.1 MAG: hypothetical protein A3D81_01100 [Candidatus Curtissbacteria bacterium RIFCSPHIGHO2_02_FULL_40_17]OGE04036.1 MAG: hypothetical protein A3F45_02785 [Candidatus Curtissbacteria bacterium RIFCSPHIGHO2_12_FULL_41_17]OGE08589.1 MAG: hypothetical protein A3I53_02350 [Candidatus Curtissbacteria bacterium RIFCSPLOWO2_02_FULL_40_13b]